MIRPVHLNDAQQLLDIYNYYVVNTTVTFDLEALSLDTFSDKIKSTISDYPFVVYEENHEILGYAYGSRFRLKPAYNHTVESTIYIKHGHHGKQIGSQLYQELLHLLNQKNFHIVLGVLTLPNEASVKLHEKFGFKQVAFLNEVGLKFGTWQDVGFYQLRF